MIFDAASRAVSQLFSPNFRSVLWKSLGLTVALFFGFWLILKAGVDTFLLPFPDGFGFAETMLVWVLGAGVVLGMGFLIAPVSSVFAGIFLDDIALEVEKTHYPGEPVGQSLSLARSSGITLRFFGLVVLGNLIALILVLFLGLGVIIFFLLNGYLLGREYFQFAAMRHMNRQSADALRAKNEGTIFLAGLLVAGLLSVPILNLLTPLFAGAMMVHLFKGLQHTHTVA